MRAAVRAVFCSAILLIPTLAFAQATITGTVRDTSGGVLPGVTVEATSPSLAGTARTVVSDTAGIYRIIDLPPGAYSVTATLPGFKTIKWADRQRSRFHSSSALADSRKRSR
jgi:hypothetical protein